MSVISSKNPYPEPEKGVVEQTWRIIRRRKWVIVQAIIIVPILALLLTLRQPKEYSATATLLFRQPVTALEETSAVVDPTREAATNNELVALPVVAERAAKNLGEPDIAGDIYGSVAVTPSLEGNTAAVEVTERSPEVAAKWADAYAQAYIDFRRDSDRSQVQEAIELAEKSLAGLTEEKRESSQGESLERQLDQLKLSQALQTGGAELVQKATVPTSPSSPHPSRNVGLGIVLGALLGFGLAFLLEKVDRKVRSREELEGLYGAPVLARIPASKKIAGLSRKPAGFGTQTREGEAFRVLRTNLRFFDVDNRDARHSILVVSPEEGDGKSTVARGLATTMAEMGDEVVLVEADLRKGSDLRQLTGDPALGLSDVLGGMALDRALLRVSTPVPNLDESRHLTILPSGRIPPNPSELLESERMADVLGELQSNFSTVIFDSPAVAAVSDALALVPIVSEVVVVGGLGKTTRDAARDLRKQFTMLGRVPVGVIVNFAEADSAKYSHYYRSQPVDGNPSPR
jgi:polysaccharide biosynthesis transport protein